MRLVLLCQTSVDLREKFEPDLGHALLCQTSVDLRYKSQTAAKDMCCYVRPQWTYAPVSDLLWTYAVWDSLITPKVLKIEFFCFHHVIRISSNILRLQKSDFVKVVDMRSYVKTGVNCIVYSELNNLIEIDKNRHVVVDFNV